MGRSVCGLCLGLIEYDENNCALPCCGDRDFEYDWILQLNQPSVNKLKEKKKYENKL